MRKRHAALGLLLVVAGWLAACSGVLVSNDIQPTAQPISTASNAQTNASEPTMAAAAVKTPAPIITPIPRPTIVIPTPLPAVVQAPTSRNASSATSAQPAATPVPLLTPSSVVLETLDSLRGKILFFTDREGSSVQLYVMDANGSNPHPCNCSDIYQTIVKRETLSPDKKQFLFIRQVGGVRNQNFQIWSHNNETNEDRVVTGAPPGFPTVNYDPTWSPDTRYIAWVTEANGFDEIYLHNFSTNEDQRLTESHGEWYKHPSFSPDGSQIAFWSNHDSAVRKQIWLMNLDGTQQHNISQNSFNDYDPIWVK